jgi:hypothetical protein
MRVGLEPTTFRNNDFMLYQMVKPQSGASDARPSHHRIKFIQQETQLCNAIFELVDRVSNRLHNHQPTDHGMFVSSMSAFGCSRER